MAIGLVQNSMRILMDESSSSSKTQTRQNNVPLPDPQEVAKSMKARPKTFGQVMRKISLYSVGGGSVILGILLLPLALPLGGLGFIVGAFVGPFFGVRWGIKEGDAIAVAFGLIGGIGLGALIGGLIGSFGFFILAVNSFEKAKKDPENRLEHS